MDFRKKLRQDWAYLLSLGLLIIIFFHKLIFNPGKFFINIDMNTIYLTFSNYIIRHSNGFFHLPLWNNAIFSGVPLVSNPMFHYFFPTTLLFPLLKNIHLGIYLTIFSFFITGVSTYLFARYLNQSKKASFIAAICFMFGGSLTTKLVGGHIINIMITSFIPLGFLYLEKMIRNKRLVDSVFFSIPIFFMLLTRQIQFSFYTFLALSIYFVASCILRKHKTVDLYRLVMLFGFGFLLAFLLSGFNILPVLEISRHSTRVASSSFEYSSSFSFDPKYVTTFIMPKFYGSTLENNYWGPAAAFWDATCYISIVGLILAAVYMFVTRSKYKKILITVSLFSIFYALGSHTPAYYVFYKIIPGVSIFRAPSRIIFLFGFSMAIMAGFGFDTLFCKKHATKRKTTIKIHKVLITLVILFAAIFSITFLFENKILQIGKQLGAQRYNQLHPTEENFERDYLPKISHAYSNVQKGIVSVLLYTAVFSALLYFVIHKKSLKLIQKLILLLIIIDLFSFGIPLIKLTEPDKIFIGSDIIDPISQETEHFRIFDLSGLIRQNVATLYGVEKIKGYDSTLLSKYVKFTNLIGDYGLQLCPESFDEDESVKYCLSGLPIDAMQIHQIKNYQILNMLNVKYIIGRQIIQNTNIKLVSEYPNYIAEKDLSIYKENSENNISVYVYENTGMLPRAYMVHKEIIIKNKDKIEDELLTFDPKAQVIVDRQLGLDNRGEYKKVEIVYYSPDEIIIETNSPYKGMVILNEVNYPGWQVYVDGEQKKVLDANYIFRGVVVNPGEHKVKFKYEPISLKIGYFISCLGLLISIGILIHHRFKSSTKPK